MSPKLSREQRQAIAQSLGQPIPLEADDESQLIYVLVEQQTFDRAMKALDEREHLQSIRRGIDEMEAGKGHPLSEVDHDMRRELGFSSRS